ncbi:MAG: hypothetical protein LBT96_04245 [Campylobacteraceae bacterium]|jgi:hypothetical protein|nr:hypothetical protein [Campylobacteraceae bacterium]
MHRVLLPLFFVSLPLLATNILNYEITENDTQNIEIFLSLDNDWNGSVQQKNSDEEMVFIFEGLSVKQSAQKPKNSPAIERVSLEQSNDKKLRLALKTKQIFDAAVSNNASSIYINLTPKPAPITIEGIANDAKGGILGHILDMLLYIVIFFALLCAAFFIFIKLKLFSHTHVKTENSDLDTAQEVELSGEKADDTKDEPANSDVEDAKQSEKSKKIKKKLQISPQKKSKQSKNLFDF